MMKIRGRGNLETDCKNIVVGEDVKEILRCYKNVQIAYITSGNTKNSPKFCRVGIILEGEKTVLETFVLEYLFIKHENSPTPEITEEEQYSFILILLTRAMFVRKKVDICCNETYSDEKRIVDVAWHS